MSRGLIAGVALATAVMAGQSADAGHRRSCGCCPTTSMSSHGGWYHAQSGGGYYVPMAHDTGQVVPAPSGPPMAMGSGQTIRRFSEEPNTPPAPGTSGAPYIVESNYPTRFDTPTVGTSIPSNPSSSPRRNPVERRLHPGGGWMRN